MQIVEENANVEEILFFCLGTKRMVKLHFCFLRRKRDGAAASSEESACEGNQVRMTYSLDVIVRK